MTDTAEPQAAQPPNEVYGIFAGPIDQAAVSRVGNAAAVTTNNRITHVHLAFQTAGGTVADGVALYNIFRSFPIPLTLYSIGSVQSAGVIAFLGAANRVSSSLATFMIHRTTSPAIGATSDRLEAMTQSVLKDDARTEAIFTASNLNLTKKQKETHRFADLWFTAEEAAKAGLIQSIKEFGPPKGVQLFFLGPT
ncbi:ATP-dependent Clp protease proteolytic subunit [Bradyrhizobium genosp. A]|uniref:ATP-dependent Clp protease proteolytic subunit n=1 Tax=Bradyrhizobium genosp. A TaxID=83626 RepID=UPI003CF45A5C